jgi:hypothetical protein
MKIKISCTLEDGHVVKDGENQHNKAACRQKYNLQNPLNNTVQQDAKIYYYKTLLLRHSATIT